MIGYDGDDEENYNVDYDNDVDDDCDYETYIMIKVVKDCPNRKA